MVRQDLRPKRKKIPTRQCSRIENRESRFFFFFLYFSDKLYFVIWCRLRSTGGPTTIFRPIKNMIAAYITRKVASSKRTLFAYTGCDKGPNTESEERYHSIPDRPFASCRRNDLTGMPSILLCLQAPQPHGTSFLVRTQCMYS